LEDNFHDDLLVQLDIEKQNYFEEDFQQMNNLALTIQNFTREIDLCLTQPPHFNLQRKKTIYIGWIKPNSDGACKGDYSWCGGLFRNSERRWLKVYVRKIGVCNALYAELWGMCFGSDMVCREHILPLVVESDSKILIDMVTDNCKFSTPIPTLMRHIHNLFDLEWQVQYCQTWRGRQLLCWLAK
jgi:hypothetical protein